MVPELGCSLGTLPELLVGTPGLLAGTLNCTAAAVDHTVAAVASKLVVAAVGELRQFVAVGFPAVETICWPTADGEICWSR